MSLPKWTVMGMIMTNLFLSNLNSQPNSLSVHRKKKTDIYKLNLSVVLSTLIQNQSKAADLEN